MVLKVDLHCSTCYKKIKKLLCRSPQVRDQIFDEKQNQVTITVVSCCPDKIRDKLRYKGGKAIKSIDIKDPPKPKSKEPEKPKTDDKPKETGKPKPDDKPKEPEKPKVEEPPKPTKIPEGKPAAEKPQALVVDPPAYSVPGTVAPEHFVQYGYPVVNAGWGYGEPSNEGYVGAPYYNNGYGRPVPPQPYYNGYNYGYEYSEETPSMCTIV